MADRTDIEFLAPWNARLRSSSLVSVLVLSALFISGIVSWSRTGWPLNLTLLGLPIVIVASTVLTMVRGYVLTESELRVRRLGWETRLPLDGLVSVTGDNEAMQRSIRLFGNGGMFAFTGEFWNRSLGRYRALATDPTRAVVLKYANRRIVITPHDPQKFIVQARMRSRNRR
jgi:hypothetical protein